MTSYWDLLVVIVWRRKASGSSRIKHSCRDFRYKSNFKTYWMNKRVCRRTYAARKSNPLTTVSSAAVAFGMFLFPTLGSAAGNSYALKSDNFKNFWTKIEKKYHTFLNFYPIFHTHACVYVRLLGKNTIRVARSRPPEPCARLPPPKRPVPMHGSGHAARSGGGGGMR